MKGVDFSRYSTANLPLAVETFEVLTAAGVKLIIPGAWHGNEGYDAVNETLKRGRERLFHTATYIALSPGRSGREHVERAQALVGNEWDHLRFAAIDCELDGITIQMIHEAEETVRASGIEPILYSAKWWWVGHFGDPHDFAYMRLWNAWYDGDPDHDGLPYGGWTEAACIGEQYTNTTRVNPTLSVDWNEFSDDFIVPKEEAIMRRHIAISAWYANAFKKFDSWKPGLWEVFARKDFDLLPTDRAIIAEIVAIPAPGGSAIGTGLYVLDGDKQFSFAVPADGLTHQGLVFPDGSADGKFYIIVVGGPLYISRMACILAE
jgi:hypothetical protein